MGAKPQPPARPASALHQLVEELVQLEVERGALVDEVKRARAASDRAAATLFTATKREEAVAARLGARKAVVEQLRLADNVSQDTVLGWLNSARAKR